MIIGRQRRLSTSTPESQIFSTVGSSHLTQNNQQDVEW